MSVERYVFAALTAVLVGMTINAAAAAGLDSTGLRNAGWQNTQPGKVACNYLYTNAAMELLYYGTSADCATRMAQHANEMWHAENMLTLIEGKKWVSAPTFRKTLWDWVTDVDKNGNPYAGRGQADTCLAIAHVKESDLALRMWWKKLDSGATAFAVEKCVLAKNVGICNRQGAGVYNNSMSADAFTTTINACIASNSGEMKD